MKQVMISASLLSTCLVALAACGGNEDRHTPAGEQAEAVAQPAEVVSLPISTALTPSLTMVVENVIRPDHAKARYATLAALPENRAFQDWQMTRGSVFGKEVAGLELGAGMVLVEIQAAVKNKSEVAGELRIEAFELLLNEAISEPWELLPGMPFGSYSRTVEQLSLSDQPPGDSLIKVMFDGGLICALQPATESLLVLIFEVPDGLKQATLRVRGEESTLAEIVVPTI